MIKTKLLLKVLTCSLILFNINCIDAQNVNIPDEIFKNALLAHGTTITGAEISVIDTDNNGEISVEEAQAYTGTIDLYNKGVTNLTGIEAFTNLTVLNCPNNQLTSLNVSANTALTKLSCINNQLTSLDVSANTALIRLYCSNNKLSSLNVSANTALIDLQCAKNQLNNLNVSTNTALITLRCSNNPLGSLNVSENTALTTLKCSYNSLSSLDVSANTALKVLVCFTNQLTSLDVSANTSLTSLNCGFNQLTSLDTSVNTSLTALYCFQNQLTSLNIANGNNKNMGYMHARSNSSLTCINTDADIVGTNPNNWQKDAAASYSVNCGSASTCNNIINIPDTNFKNALLTHGTTITGTQISKIDTDGDGEICQSEAQAYTGAIDIYEKDVTNLTGIEHFVNITALNCNYNSLSTIDLSANTALKVLNCSYNQLSTLDISTNTALTLLGCRNNQLSSLDVSANKALRFLDCKNNQLSSLDVSANTALTSLGCRNNQLSSLDVSINTALTSLDCGSNQLTGLNIANGNNSSMDLMRALYNSSLTCIQTDANIVGTNPNGWQKDSGASYSSNCDSASTCTNIVSIPDANFKNALLNHSPVIDTDRDGEICESEAQAFTGTLSLVGKSISNLTGIEAFTTLKKIDISRNSITALDLSKNTSLEELYVTKGNLTSINVTKNTNLIKLIIWGNNLSEIDLTQNIKLQTLNLANNRFTAIDVSKNTELLAFSIGKNQLNSIDVSKNIKLTALFIYNNKFTQLDISKNTALTRLRSDNNELTSLNIANGNNTNMTLMQAQNNSSLTCIQTDADILGTIPYGWGKDSGSSYSANCGTASVNEVSFNDSFKIYPNPVGSILTIKTDNTTIKHIEIYNILGKKILKTTNKSINVSKLVKGVYIVKIQSTEGKIATRKLIKK